MKIQDLIMRQLGKKNNTRFCCRPPYIAEGGSKAVGGRL